MRAFVHKIFFFTAVGICSSVVYAFSVFLSVEQLRLNPFEGQAIGLILSSASSYFGHHALTFKVDGRHVVHAPRFIIQTILTGLLSTCLLGAVTVLHMSYIFSVVGTITIIPLINFLLMQFWVFGVSSAVRSKT